MVFWEPQHETQMSSWPIVFFLHRLVALVISNVVGTNNHLVLHGFGCHVQKTA